MVIGAYFQPSHSMALKITCPTDGERAFSKSKVFPFARLGAADAEQPREADGR